MANEELDAIQELATKYERLVWYGRSGVNFDNYSPELQQSVEEIRLKVETDYPKETWEYNNYDKSDFYHGFNSGCLAAFRFALTAFDQSIEFDEEDPKKVYFRWGGVDNAKERFPELDT